MANIRSIDMMFLDQLFRMEHGYVLDFKDWSMTRFFADDLDIDIDDARYAVNGGSKGKRLRCLLQTADKPTVVRVLHALWEYREAERAKTGVEETLQNAHGRLLTLINRLEGKADAAPAPSAPAAKAFDRARIEQLRQALIALAALPPQPRGYAFEAFLKQMFDCFGLEAREPFRLRGEQIDGSFQLANETYLLEAKWENKPTAADDLHVFHGKLEQKASWARGLFISNSGFTDEGLTAFGRGKRLVCMDGLDLHDTLYRELPLIHVLERKIRRAAETGLAFVRVRDLFPT